MSQASNDRLLSRIIVFGFAAAFGLVIASLQALHSTRTGFAIEISLWTLLALLVGTVVMAPVFHLIVHSRSRALRRAALGVVVLVGVGSFFYPMRVVPPERWRAVFIGLAAAGCALSILAALLVTLYRFFERNEAESRS